MPIHIVRRLAQAVALLALALPLAGCLSDVAPALKQLPAEAQALLAKKGMRQDAPILVRIFKEESELEIWKKMDDGRFALFKTYPICSWSGTLGPKLKQGDKQAPEGFYTVTPGQMNPHSSFHLSFNLGFPNAYDRANGRTGAHLMVHGDCRSAGCYAMTNALIEEIYILAREAFKGGQRSFQVEAFPFRMTEANMLRHRKDKWYSFWASLKRGYDAFQETHVPPSVAVCSRRYLVNAEFFGHIARPDPAEPCPPHRKLDPQTYARLNQTPRPHPSAAATMQAGIAAPGGSGARAEPAPTVTGATGQQPVGAGGSVKSAPAATAQAGTLQQPWVTPSSGLLRAQPADDGQPSQLGYSANERSALDAFLDAPINR